MIVYIALQVLKELFLYKIQLFSIFDLILGGPFDLMSRRIIAAGSKTLAERIVKEIHIVPFQRDDED